VGFKIIRDFIETGAVGIESVRQTGFNALFMTEEQQKGCEYHGGKIKVRLKDDDGGIYYHAYVDDIEGSCELLLDWGMGYAGTTCLDLHIVHWIQEYGEEKPSALSKDGKWVGYMS